MAISFLSSRVYIEPDPLEAEVYSQERFSPVPLHGHKVTKPMAKRILRMRKKLGELSMAGDKRLAIIIPYRDRAEHLEVLLPALQDALTSQAIDYRITVVEQEYGKAFNPGLMRNIGADLNSDFAEYFCFHDVDNIPVAGDYRCPSMPLRLVGRWAETSRDRDIFAVSAIFGTTVAITRDQFRDANGYPNDFWGWGKEDDVFFLRLLLRGYVPHQDNRGLFRDLENPASEAGHRADSVRYENKRRIVRKMRWNTLTRGGVNDLRYKVTATEQLAPGAKKYTVSV